MAATTASVATVLATILTACLLSVQRVGSQCIGGVLTLQASVVPTKFSSPGYPSAYNNDLSCTWLVDSGVEGQPILLFSDAYDIHCPDDSVTIYDGNSTSSPVLQAGLCGSSHTGEFVTSGRHALVTFTTDSSLTETGFELTYLSAADTSGTGCSSEYTVTATMQPQYLTSHDFPALYSSNSFCRWHIVASSALSTVNIQLQFADIEADESCRYDKLEIYDGSYICENKLVSKQCPFRVGADIVPTTYTASQAMTIVLSSDNSFDRHGFIMSYWETTVTTMTTLSPSRASPTTTASTTKASPATSAESVALREQYSDSSTNIALMVVSGLSGAGGVLALLAVWRTFWYLKGKKRLKKGLIQVQSVQSVSSISNTSLTSRQGPPASILAFV